MHSMECDTAQNKYLRGSNSSLLGVLHVMSGIEAAVLSVGN